MNNRRTKLRLLAMLVAILGIGLIVKSSYVYGKAQLAQFLLWQAWQSNKQSTHSRNKAWYYADGFPVGELTVATHNISQVVLNEASNRNMAFAPGVWHHASNNTILAAHNDTHFSFVKHLEIGDELSYLAQGNEALHYKVETLVEVDHRDTDWLLGYENYLVLITCQRRDRADVVPSDRLVVLAAPVG